MFMPVSIPEVKNYQISLVHDSSPTCVNNSEQTESAIQIMRMRDDAPYDTTRMFYSSSQYQLNSYARHEWAALPSQMLTKVIQEKLIGACQYSSVVNADFMTAAKYRLNSQLVELKQNITGDRAEIKLAVLIQLVDNGSNQVIKSKTFVERVKTQPNPEGYVDGTNIATKMFLDELVLWLK